jgi:hypothetical protein
MLAGCDALTAGGSLSFLETGDTAENLALTRADLAGGAVTVLGPDGYCVDASTLRSTLSNGFAAIASCRILSGGRAGSIVEPGLVTVIVSSASDGVPTPESLAKVLDTDLLETRELSAVTVGQMATGGDTAFDGSDPRHWRGTFTLGEHVVGLALYAPKGSPLVGAQGAAFLNTVSSRIRANSKASDRSAEQSQSSQDPVTTRLSRLFGSRDLQ